MKSFGTSTVPDQIIKARVDAASLISESSNSESSTAESDTDNEEISISRVNRTDDLTLPRIHLPRWVVYV